METSKNHYIELAKIDVGEHIEKKGKFSYLSWAWAVDQLRRYDPTATWETIRFNGMPFMKTECGYFVEVAVTVNGITLSQIHPVLDNNNKPIAQPNAFQINTSIQRCLVKAIALHGLGLYIYAGEDLPFDDEADPEPKKIVQNNKPLENYIPLDKGNPSEPDKSKIIVVLSKWQTLSVEKDKKKSDESFGQWVKDTYKKEVEALTVADLNTIEKKLTERLKKKEAAAV